MVTCETIAVSSFLCRVIFSAPVASSTTQYTALPLTSRAPGSGRPSGPSVESSSPLSLALGWPLPNLS